MAPLKILIVADGMGKEIYELAFCKGFEELGCDVFVFSWADYFEGLQYNPVYKDIKSILKTLYYKIQNKFRLGPVVDLINADLLSVFESYNPDFIFLYRPTHILERTIIDIKNRKDVFIFTYNNDDPFSSKYSGYFWSNYFKVAKLSDHVYVYRESNLRDNYNIGINKTSVLRSYYIKEKNFPLEVDRTLDVIFIGHWEDDGRDEMLKFLIENGVNLKLFGTGWDKSSYYCFFKDRVGQINAVYGDEYNLLLNKAKISLVFLSKRNNDTYTRRCFEIPITKSLMMSEYTEDLANLYQPDVEAVYFSNKEELLEKVNYYLKNDHERQCISENGFNKVREGGHEVIDRCKDVLNLFYSEK